MTEDAHPNGHRWSESVADQLTAFGQSSIAAATRCSGTASITGLSALVFLILAQASFLVAQSPQQPSPSSSASAIKSMIEGLGDDDFLVRQQSSESLLNAGSVAIPHLEHAQTSVDQEVLYRVNDILKKLFETDPKERANRFLALPPTSSDDCGFEHWRTFAPLAGTSREARSLLVKIYGNPQSEKLLESIDLGVGSSANVFEDAKTTPFDDQSVTTSVTVYAAEMYRRSMRAPDTTDNPIPRLTGNGLIEELASSAFESNFLSLSPITVQQSKNEEAFLKLLAAWLRVELQSTPLTVAKLKIISAYRLKSFADDLSAAVNQPQYPHKQAALEAIAKISSAAGKDEPSLSEDDFAADDAISKLKPFISSNEVLARLPQAETQGPVDVSLGDIAFQLILKHQGKAPKDFGMSEANGKLFFDNSTVFCFTNPEARRQAIEQWLIKLDASQSSATQ